MDYCKRTRTVQVYIWYFSGVLSLSLSGISSQGLTWAMRLAWELWFACFVALNVSLLQVLSQFSLDLQTPFVYTLSFDREYHMSVLCYTFFFVFNMTPNSLQILYYGRPFIYFIAVMILYTSMTWCKVPFSVLSPACPSLPLSCCIFSVISAVLWNFFQAICSMSNSTAPSIHPCRTFLVSPPQEPQERLFMLYAILLNFQSLWQGTSSKGFQKSKKTSLTFIHMLVDSLTLKQEFPLELQSRTQQNCTLHPFFWRRRKKADFYMFTAMVYQLQILFDVNVTSQFILSIFDIFEN